MADLPPGFRWLPGMLDTDGYRVVDIDPASEWLLLAKVDGEPECCWWPAHTNTPAFADPLTALGLLVLVREAWGDATAFVCYVDGWSVVVRKGANDRQTIGPFATETEALLAALAAAPTHHKGGA